MEALHALAASQHGLVTRGQLLDSGFARGTFDQWMRKGRLRRVRSGVFAMPGSVSTDLQALMAAVLAAGDALASHRAAGWLWGLRTEPALELSVASDRRPRLPGVSVHRRSDFATIRRSTRQGIPVTNPLRSVLDLGAVESAENVRIAVETALTRRLVSVRGLTSELDRAARSGRAGISTLRRILETRALLDRPPDSVLESRIAPVFRRYRLPRPVYQYVVRVDGRFIARVDFAYPEVRLAIEVDGHQSHATPAQLQSDLTRQNLLVGAGWTVLRFTWADVVGRPEMVAAAIRRQLARLQAA